MDRGVAAPDAITPEEYLDGILGNAQYLTEEKLADLKQEARDFVLTFYGEGPVPQGITDRLKAMEGIHGGL